MIEIKINKIAGGGICVALCLVFLFASSFIKLRLAILFITSVVIGICILRYKTPTALMTYLAVSIISIFILPIPNKIVSWCFFAVFGIYPVIKLYIEKIKNIIVEYIIKFVLWNFHLFILYIIFSAFGQNSLFDLGTFWVWLVGILAMAAYDLSFGIFINYFYKTYYKFLN